MRKTKLFKLSVKVYVASFTLLLGLGNSAFARDLTSVRSAVEKEIAGSGLKIGFAALLVESSQLVSVNGRVRLPMASVYKFPIALAVLHEIEEHRLTLAERIAIRPEDIRGGAAGPIAKNFPNGGGSLSISSLLEYMVSNSDNSACDLLLKRIGGPAEATQTLEKWGYKQISIDRYEKELVENESLQSEQLDTASAENLVQLYARFWSGQLLNPKHTRLLIGWMEHAHTPQHIGKGLPPNTPIFHKSGWCSGNKCINDTAMITLPDKHGHLAIAILATGEIRDTERLSKLIGKLARLAFDAAASSK